MVGGKHGAKGTGTVLVTLSMHQARILSKHWRNSKKPEVDDGKLLVHFGEAGGTNTTVSIQDFCGFCTT